MSDLKLLFRDLTQLGLPKSQFSIMSDETSYNYNPDRYNFYVNLLDSVADPEQKIASKVFGILARNRRQHEKIQEKIDHIAAAISYLKTVYTREDQTGGDPKNIKELETLKTDLNAKLPGLIRKEYEFTENFSHIKPEELEELEKPEEKESVSQETPTIPETPTSSYSLSSPSSPFARNILNNSQSVQAIIQNGVQQPADTTDANTMVQEQHITLLDQINKAINNHNYNYNEVYDLINNNLNAFKAIEQNEKDNIFINLFKQHINGIDVINLLKLLLENGANPNIQFYDNNNNTALHIAINLDNTDVFDLLLTHLDNTNANIQNNNGFTPLHIATIRRNEVIVGRLLTKSVDANIQDNYGNTPLHYAFRDLSDTFFVTQDRYDDNTDTLKDKRNKIINLLLNKTDVTIKNIYFQTPLLLACKYIYTLLNPETIINNLLEATNGKTIINDEDIITINSNTSGYSHTSQNKLTILNNTPLSSIDDYNYINIVNLLLSNGAIVNDNSIITLKRLYSSYKDYKKQTNDKLENVITNYDNYNKIYDNEFPLITAINKNELDNVNSCIKYGANINSYSYIHNVKKYPLYLAIELKHDNIVNALLNAPGIDITLPYKKDKKDTKSIINNFDHFNNLIKNISNQIKEFILKKLKEQIIKTADIILRQQNILLSNSTNEIKIIYEETFENFDVQIYFIENILQYNINELEEINKNELEEINKIYDNNNNKINPKSHTGGDITQTNPLNVIQQIGGSYFSERLNELTKAREKNSTKKQREEAEDIVAIEYKNNPLYSPELEQATYTDRIVFIAVTFVFRAITLLLVQSAINTQFINTFVQAFSYYFLIYSILFSIWILIVNMRKDSHIMGLLFYYVNANYDASIWFKRIGVHLLLQLLILPIPILLTPKFKNKSETDSFEKRERLYNTLTFFTFIIWIITSLIALRA